MSARAHDSRPHVLVVGGGFGGLAAARALRKAPVRVTLVDRKNFHLFQPLLYEVATATFSPADITQPLRSATRGLKNCRVLLGEVTDIEPAARVVRVEGRTVHYDYLVLAAGLRNAYHGHPAWAAVAPGLKSVEDALEIRRRFLRAFEEAEWETDAATRRALHTFVVVGAGSTGMELAGALAETIHRVLRHDFRSSDPGDARVILVEAADQVLPDFPRDLAAKALRQIERLGVEVLLNTRVQDVDARGVVVDGQRIESRTVFWAAGVRGSPLAEALDVPLDPQGRVVVEPDASIPDRPEVFVVGDLARVESRGRVVTGVAPAAIQMARHAARCIEDDLAGRPRRPFRYFDKGTAATIARAAAVARAGRIKVSGLPAWLAWVVIHLVYLVGFRDRLAVATQWAVAWLVGAKGVRLITDEWRPTPEETAPAAPPARTATPVAAGVGGPASD